MPDALKIKHKLVDRGMTQADLARSSGIEPSYISRILRDDIDVQESTLKRLAKALGCKVEEIW